MVMVGNLPNYSKIDILRCFIRLGKGTSRHHLAKELELGEGTIRTILGILKSRGLLDSTIKGHFLSAKGSKLQDTIYTYITAPKKLEIKNLYPEYKKMGVVIRHAKNFGELYKLRDIAVRNGADGALILKFDSKLYLPKAGNDYKYGELEKNFDFNKGDALIIGFSNKKRSAEAGALSIAVELNKILQKFINEF